ncbi:MAG: peptidoglycan DD-metalloendopeptidase family protein [Flavobacteriales bacterium]
MARPHYRFNERKLRYEATKKGFGARILAGLPAFLGGSVLAVLITLGGLYVTGNAPFKRLHLQKENQRLLKQYEKLNREFKKVDRTLAKVQKRDDSLYRTIFGAEPIPQNVRQAGVGGADRYKHLRDQPHSQLLVKAHSKLDQLKKELKVQKNSFQELMRLARQKRKFMTHVPAIRPLREDRIDHIASGFGMRFHPIYRVLKMHSGIDFTADIGTPVHVTGDGVVTRVEKDRAGYGHNVLVDHGHGFETLYAHLSEFKVKKGDKVQRGEVVGLTGNTGTSTGPHLHYEVIRDGKKVDPVNHFFSDLTPKEYRRVVNAAERAKRSL